MFFTEWRHLIADLSPEVKIEIYEGISDYAETGVVPDMSPVAAAVFPFIKKEIDEKNKQNNEISQKRRNARNKHNKTKKNDNTQQNSTKTDFVDDCKAKTETADNTQQNSTKSDFVSICKTDTEKNDNTQQNPKDEKVPFNGFPLNNPLSLISEKEEKKEIKENTPYGVLKKNEKSGLEILEIPSPPGSAPPPSPRIDYSAIMRDFNARFAGVLPAVTVMTEKRKAAVKARIGEHGMDSIAKVFDNIAASGFLKGHNDHNWKADFDWVFRPTNYVKILEGNYAKIGYGRKEQRQFGNTRPGDFAGKGYTDI